MGKNIGWFERARRFSERQVNSYGAQYNAFVVFIAIFFLAAPYRWINPGHYPEYVLYGLRIFSYILCGLILFRNFWPRIFQAYLPLFWHFTLFYCFPFRTTFNVLYSQHSSSFNKFGVLGIVALAVLVDRTSFVILLGLGIVGGIAFFLVTGGASAAMPDDEALKLAVLMFGVVTFTKLVFFRNNEIATKKKLDDFLLLAASIAHEVRSPLATVSQTSSGIKIHMPALIGAYRMAEEAGLPVEPIATQQLDALESITSRFELVSQRALNTINQLLSRIRNSVIPEENQDFSVTEAVHSAVKDYPFEGELKGLVHVESEQDFVLRGNRALFIQVVTNLIQNSLHAISLAGKGSIKVGVKVAPKKDVLVFRDTGSGIRKEVVPHIFDHFFTKKKHGSGIGLTFCKLIVEELSGTISCRSVEGEFTEFEMTFPHQIGK